eukprot:8743669-Pyramimonas_sp.AAC.1
MATGSIITIATIMWIAITIRSSSRFGTNMKTRALSGSISTPAIASLLVIIRIITGTTTAILIATIITITSISTTTTPTTTTTATTTA